MRNNVMLSVVETSGRITDINTIYALSLVILSDSSTLLRSATSCDRYASLLRATATRAGRMTVWVNYEFLIPNSEFETR